MKSCVLALALVAVVFSAPTVYEDDFSADFETELVQDETVADLNNMLAELKKVAPAHLQGHVSHMAEHAELIQFATGEYPTCRLHKGTVWAMCGDLEIKSWGIGPSGQSSAIGNCNYSASRKKTWGKCPNKAGKAYAHDNHKFQKSKKAITDALKSLNDDLTAGSTHDKQALATARSDNTNVINNADSKNKAFVKSKRGKACPTKRAEEAADEAKKKAKSEMDAIYNKKICPISTTWRDMDIEKDVSNMGTKLSNEWARVRETYMGAKSKHGDAVKTYDTAVQNNNNAMTVFTTALGIQADDTLSTCNTAHAEYEALKRDVASNVVTRKQTYVAALVIGCYVNHMTDNAAAKTCADSKRNASTTHFDITPPGLAACSSKADNMAAYGPATWKPTAKACKSHTSTSW